MTILIVDAMPVCYQAFSTVGHFCTKDKEPTGLRYGFLRSVRSWSEKFKARKTVVVWDTPHPILKAEGSTSYKADREDTDERRTMFSQLAGVKEMLGYSAYTQVEAPGYEADDLCFTLAKLYDEQYQEDVVVATPDRDHFRSVSNRVRVFHTTKDRKMIGLKEVFDHFGVGPIHVPAIKAVAGDVSDNIDPLINDNDLKGFKNYLNLNPDMPSFNAISIYFNDYDDLKAGALLNLRITELHQVPQEAWTILKGQKNAAAMTELFKRLEFASMMKFVDQITSDANWPAKVVKAKK